MSNFVNPAGPGDQLKPADVLGHALIICPTEVVCDIETTFGPADAIRVNVADLTDGTVHLDVLWFPRGLLSSLRSNVGQTVLAQMAQGVAKPGQSPPWTLHPLADNAEAVAAAEAWLTANPGALDAPTTQAAVPASSFAPPAPALAKF